MSLLVFRSVGFGRWPEITKRTWPLALNPGDATTDSVTLQSHVTSSSLSPLICEVWAIIRNLVGWFED